MGKISDFLFEEENTGLILGAVFLLAIAMTLVFVLKIDVLVTENLQLKNKILNLEQQPKSQPSPQFSSPDSLRARWRYWDDDDSGPR